MDKPRDHAWMRVGLTVSIPFSILKLPMEVANLVLFLNQLKKAISQVLSRPILEIRDSFQDNQVVQTLVAIKHHQLFSLQFKDHREVAMQSQHLRRMSCLVAVLSTFKRRLLQTLMMTMGELLMAFRAWEVPLTRLWGAESKGYRQRKLSLSWKNSKISLREISMISTFTMIVTYLSLTQETNRAPSSERTSSMERLMTIAKLMKIRGKMPRECWGMSSRMQSTSSTLTKRMALAKWTSRTSTSPSASQEFLSTSPALSDNDVLLCVLSLLISKNHSKFESLLSMEMTLIGCLNAQQEAIWSQSEKLLNKYRG